MGALDEVTRRVDVLRRRHALRDAHAARVRAVRHGEWDKVAPGLFSDEWPAPIVANRIDVFARHASAALSPLPSFSCQSSTSTSDSARTFADKRTRIVNHYARRSRLQAQMQTGADQFYTYGILVTAVEPDYVGKFPHIYLEESSGVYPRWDRLGRTLEVAHVFERNALELCDEFPDAAEAIRREVGEGVNARLRQIAPDKNVEVVKYVSDTRVAMYVSSGRIPLVDMPNPLGRCYYVVTQRPGLDKEIRGAFDDLVWVQLALHSVQTMALSAAAQAVDAPFAVPNDVTSIAFGPGEVVRSNDPQNIRRVGADVPDGAFSASAILQGEVEYGAMVPEALGGSIDASVVTGKGVQQLMAGYSQQIANAQQSLVGHFEQVLSLCLEMDEKFWPDEDKNIQGVADATPYKFTYRPSRDIRGDYSVDVAYGGVAGLDPNRALVFLLQALGGDLVSKDYVRRNLPTALNPQDEESKIAAEKLRASLLEGVSAWVQSIPAMAAQGQDPSSIVAGTIKALEEVQKGKSVEDALRVVFPEPPPPEEPAAPGAPAAAGVGGGPDGFGPGGLPDGLTAGVASRGPGARPDLAMMFAGTNGNGSPNLQAGVSRYLPAGGGA